MRKIANYVPLDSNYFLMLSQFKMIMLFQNFNEMFFLWFQVGYGLDFSKHIETEECQFKNIPHALTNEVGLNQNRI